jgi:hypothetical protein
MGTVQWNATFTAQGGGTLPVAQVCDTAGEPRFSRVVPCNPPVDCNFDTKDVTNGNYVARLRSGNDDYYYVQGQQVITAPNQLSQATIFEISSEHPTAGVVINVNI